MSESDDDDIDADVSAEEPVWYMESIIGHRLVKKVWYVKAMWTGYAEPSETELRLAAFDQTAMVLAYMDQLPAGSDKDSMMDVVDEVLIDKDELGEIKAFTAMMFTEDGVLVLVTEWQDSDVVSKEPVDIMLYDQFDRVVAFLRCMDDGAEKAMLQDVVTSHEEYLADQAKAAKPVRP
jgi:hypothetical protein